MTGEGAPLLVLGVGNPSRGDDAVGLLFLESLAAARAGAIAAGELELLTDFQLQIEHAMDLEGRSVVVFVDASVAAPAPFSFAPVSARPEAQATSHALEPAALLETYRRVMGEPPRAWVLAIRGERFELGEGLSASAGANLEQALRFFLEEGLLLLAVAPGARAGGAPRGSRWSRP